MEGFTYTTQALLPVSGSPIRILAVASGEPLCSRGGTTGAADVAGASTFSAEHITSTAFCTDFDFGSSQSGICRRGGDGRPTVYAARHLLLVLISGTAYPPTLAIWCSPRLLRRACYWIPSVDSAFCSSSGVRQITSNASGHPPVYRRSIDSLLFAPKDQTLEEWPVCFDLDLRRPPSRRACSSNHGFDANSSHHAVEDGRLSC